MKKILIVTALLLFGSSGAWAEGTEAGTKIENNATLSYSAGGVAQPDVNTTAPDVFLVDKKIDMNLVTTDSDQIPVTPGQTERITSYSFRNEGNADQNFSFTVANLADGQKADYDEDADDPDSEDVTDLYISCDGGANWATEVTVEVAIDSNITCQVKANIPDAEDGGEDGDIMNIELNATAVDASGAPEDDDDNDTQGEVDIVFAEGISGEGLGSSTSGRGDKAGDGIDAARSGYIIQTPVLSVEKTSCVIEDPVNGTDHPKRIPGAKIRYLFDIENTGTGDVKDMNLTDVFQDELDLTSTVDSAKKEENLTTDCACAGDLSSKDSADASLNSHEMTIENLNVEHGSTHTCVWVEVEIE